MYKGRRNKVIERPMPIRPILLGKYDVILGSQTISYTLKRSYKAKLIWLDIKPQSGLTVTIPSDYELKDLTEYLNMNSKWILRNFSRFCSGVRASSITSKHPANTISYLGKRMKVMQDANYSGANTVKLEQNRIIIHLHSSGESFSVQELMVWLKNQAARMINEKVNKFSQKMGVRYNRVVIREQKSRWGSCSYLKNLNFNWRLIMAPEPVLDYVIVHELCHLKEMSHSRSFWELVANECPRWRSYRSWLDDHGLEFNAQIKF